jgi:hypothetical protein
MVAYGYAVEEEKEKKEKKTSRGGGGESWTPTAIAWSLNFLLNLWSSGMSGASCALGEALNKKSQEGPIQTSLFIFHFFPNSRT